MERMTEASDVEQIWIQSLEIHTDLQHVAGLIAEQQSEPIIIHLIWPENIERVIDDLMNGGAVDLGGDVGDGALT